MYLWRSAIINQLGKVLRNGFFLRSLKFATSDQRPDIRYSTREHIIIYDNHKFFKMNILFFQALQWPPKYNRLWVRLINYARGCEVVYVGFSYLKNLLLLFFSYISMMMSLNPFWITNICESFSHEMNNYSISLLAHLKNICTQSVHRLVQQFLVDL